MAGGASEGVVRESSGRCFGPALARGSTVVAMVADGAGGAGATVVRDGGGGTVGDGTSDGAASASTLGAAFEPPVAGPPSVR